MKFTIIYMAALFFLMVSCSRNSDQITRPSDGKSILDGLGLAMYSSEVFQGSGGRNQKQVWIKLAVPSSEINEILNNSQVMNGLSKSESSTLVASGQAEFIVKLDSNLSVFWIPSGYEIEDGYSGNRKSLAIYKSKKTNVVIIIVSTFR